MARVKKTKPMKRKCSLAGKRTQRGGNSRAASRLAGPCKKRAAKRKTR